MGKHTESLQTRWLIFVVPLNGKSNLACQATQAGQPVAVGDQQISDVAVMPLMKLTQHSLPLRRPLRGLLVCV